MADKKIIEKKDVKENNSNDDEEVLKNNDAEIQTDAPKDEVNGSKNKNEKTQDPEITGIS